MKISGKCWVFGDHINTDLLYPHASFQAPPAERRLLCLSTIRPGWSELVSEGDILVGGINFGTGSGRPAAHVLHDIGIRGIVAASVGGLFYRGCVNSAVPILECPQIGQLVTEGDTLEIDYAAGAIRNRSTGGSTSADPVPPELLEIVESGGVLERLMKAGYLEVP